MKPLSARPKAPRAPSEQREAQATLAEVFAPTAADGAATAFALAHLAPGARTLWVQDRASRREGGRPYAPALGAGLIHLEVPQARDVLWAMEQALACEGLAAVIGEVWGAPAALGFTATKRLALRAEAGGVQAWLLRGTAAPGLSAARERWRVASLASRDWDGPSWQATLFRSRSRPPAEWVASHDGQRLVLRRPAQVAAAQVAAAQVVAVRGGPAPERSRPAA